MMGYNHNARVMTCVTRVRLFIREHWPRSDSKVQKVFVHRVIFTADGDDPDRLVFRRRGGSHGFLSTKHHYNW